MFAPRPYPLPSLENVPHEYVVKKLNEIAGSYWRDTASADCVISTLAFLGSKNAC
jgi:hypothetical protein